MSTLAFLGLLVIGGPVAILSAYAWTHEKVEALWK